MSLNHNDFARPDLHRAQRKGVPEIILTDRKTAEQSIAIARTFLERTARATTLPRRPLPSSVSQ